jgi:hypothetical protein
VKRKYVIEIERTRLFNEISNLITKYENGENTEEAMYDLLWDLQNEWEDIVIANPV